MKTTCLNLLIFTLLFTGCNSDDPEGQENSIYGTWQLVQIFDGGSPPPRLHSVSHGSKIRFSITGEVTSPQGSSSFPSRFVLCYSNTGDEAKGTYSLTDVEDNKVFGILAFYFYEEINIEGILTVTACPSENVSFDYGYLFRGSDLIIAPYSEYAICVEGCFDVYRKIAEETTVDQ